MTESKLAREQVDALYRCHAAGVHRFLLGVLRDADLSDEALQQTFLRVLEQGHQADAETMKGWIYKVAFNQAMALRRRQRMGGRLLEQMALDPSLLRSIAVVDGIDRGIDEGLDGALGVRYADGRRDRVAEIETLSRAEAAVEELPPAQKEVLRMRISEAKTFAQIAEQLGIPLGTALTRMRLALEKLRRKLR